MIQIHKYLADKKSNILLQVHDEIICEIHDSELEDAPFKIKDLLEQNSLDIPLKVDMEICSPSWATKNDFTTPDYLDWDDVPVTDKDFIDW
jgi:DNA polymerase I-like protein with 3'-5' exonuclease and polymerase domains